MYTTPISCRDARRASQHTEWENIDYVKGFFIGPAPRRRTPCVSTANPPLCRPENKTHLVNMLIDKYDTAYLQAHAVLIYNE